MIIIGCDYHPGVQQIALVDTETGEFQETRLQHREAAEQFYRELALRGEQVRVGMEASGQARWFERLLAELQMELWIGDAAEIRARRVRKKKTDREDARHILRLLAEDRFPRIWVPSWENRRQIPKKGTKLAILHDFQQPSAARLLPIVVPGILGQKGFVMARRIRSVSPVLLLLVLLGAQLSAQNTRKTALLNILVTDQNNAYIGGAQVKICPHAGVLPKNPQQTYQDGTLQLNLAPGSYDLYIASPAFKSWYRRVDLRAESSETITAVLDVVARTLIHSGHGMVGTPSPQPEPELLKVVVTDEAGAPVAYASLEGFPDPNTVADEKGELRLKLAPITYLIGVTSPGYERWEKMVEVIPHHDNVVKVVLKRMSTSIACVSFAMVGFS